MKFNIIITLIFLTIFMSCKTMNSGKSDKLKNPQVIRTDFTDNFKWDNICKQIVKPDSEFGFQAYVEFIDNENFKDKTVADLKKELNDSSYKHHFFFIVDSVSLNNREMPILCVSRDHRDSIDRFRVIPEEMWIIENNLSTLNVFFEELLYSVDEEGVHRVKMK